MAEGNIGNPIQTGKYNIELSNAMSDKFEFTSVDIRVVNGIAFGQIFAKALVNLTAGEYKLGSFSGTYVPNFCGNFVVTANTTIGGCSSVRPNNNLWIHLSDNISANNVLHIIVTGLI